MLRIAGRTVYQHCLLRETSAAQIARAVAPTCSGSFRVGDKWGRGLSTSSDTGKGQSRLVEISTKDQFVDFPRDKSILYFTAKWCPPCRRVGPFIADMSAQDSASGIEFGKIDIDDNPDATSMAKILSVPTFKFYQGGDEIDSYSGSDAAIIEKKVTKLAES